MHHFSLMNNAHQRGTVLVAPPGLQRQVHDGEGGTSQFGRTQFGAVHSGGALFEWKRFIFAKGTIVTDWPSAVAPYLHYRSETPIAGMNGLFTHPLAKLPWTLGFGLPCAREPLVRRWTTLLPQRTKICPFVYFGHPFALATKTVQLLPNAQLVLERRIFFFFSFFFAKVDRGSEGFCVQ